MEPRRLKGYKEASDLLLQLRQVHFRDDSIDTTCQDFLRRNGIGVHGK